MAWGGFPVGMPTTNTSLVIRVITAIAASVATGTAGIRRTPAGHPPARAWARATAPVRPYHARALTRPASPANGTAARTERRPITAAVTDRGAKSTRRQPDPAPRG